MAKEEIKITCEDGFELAATVYRPKIAKAAIMIAPATGIKRQFYNSFAQFLSDNGFAVITYDNRAIGGSKGDSLNSTDATLVNWGRLDMTAVFSALKREFTDMNYHLVGHSAGGQLVGLMGDSEELTSMFNFACSSGSIRNSTFPFILSSFFFLNIYITLSNIIFGHTKSQWVGMGEPLPKAVSSQWRRWCNGTGYLKRDLDRSIKDHYYDDLRVPSIWLHSKDDEIANLKNVKDMVRVFPKMPAKIVTLNPADYGYKDIGHMKFFSSKRQKLWSLAIDWLEQH